MEAKKRARPNLAPLLINQGVHGNPRSSVTESPKTAPVDEVMDLRSAIEAKAHRPVARTYSLSQARPQRRSEAPHPFRPKLSRQKTLSGESSNSGFGSAIFMRTFSKNYDVTSNASSSFPADEWRRLFDR